jgi:hypothetical protein
MQDKPVRRRLTLYLLVPVGFGFPCFAVLRYLV